jgi:hypothetical protein
MEVIINGITGKQTLAAKSSSVGVLETHATMYHRRVRGYKRRRQDDGGSRRNWGSGTGESDSMS